jgi:hypothetical protein
MFCAKALTYGIFLACGFGLVTYWSQFLQYYLTAYLEGNMNGPGKTEYARNNNLTYMDEMRAEWWAKPFVEFSDSMKSLHS